MKTQHGSQNEDNDSDIDTDPDELCLGEISSSKNRLSTSSPHHDDSTIVNKILEVCDQAYLQYHLSPLTIHRVLNTFSSLQNDGDENYEELESSKFTKPCRRRKYKFFITLTIILIIPLFLSIFLINPPHVLKDRRCLLPSHPVLMELVRPIPKSCTFCSGKELELMAPPKDPSSFLPYAYSSRPIIIRNYSSGPFLDFPQLLKLFEDIPGGIESVEEECQFLPFRSPFKSFKEALTRIGEDNSHDDPWYIGWSNCHPKVGERIRELVPRPRFLPEGSSVSALDWIFVGSPGKGAAMHIDYVRRPSWQLQLRGVKRWDLRPPPECEGECKDPISFTIYPGDLLFLETNTWYHETFVEGTELSISIGSEYD